MKKIFSNNIVKFMTVFILIFVMQLGIVYQYPNIGLADNGDYYRAIHTFSMSASDEDRFVNYQSDFEIESPKSVGSYIMDLSKPAGDMMQSILQLSLSLRNLP